MQLQFAPSCRISRNVTSFGFRSNFRISIRIGLLSRHRVTGMPTFARLRIGAVLISLAVVLYIPTSAHATRKTSNVVIVGDSVANVLRWAPESMKPLWSSQYNAILETWGCQQIIDKGCSPSSQLSALDRIVSHRRDNIDIYVVSTGYNDTGNAYLSAAIRKVAREVKLQGATLICYGVHSNNFTEYAIYCKCV